MYYNFDVIKVHFLESELFFIFFFIYYKFRAVPTNRMCYKITNGYSIIQIVTIGEMKMTTKQIIRRIAREHNVTPKQVEEDIKEAIRAGMASNDPQAQAIWKQIAPDGKEPSIKTFLKFCVDKINAQNEL